MIRLRPVKINANWEDKIDEYLPVEPFQKEWNEEYGDDSRYREAYKFFIPSSKLPRGVVTALKSDTVEATSFIRSLLISFVMSHSEGSIINPTSFYVGLHGSNLLIVLYPYRTSEDDPYWKDPNHRYHGPKDQMQHVLDEFFRDWDSRDMQLTGVQNIEGNLMSMEEYLDYDPTFNEQVFKYVSSATDYPLDFVRSEYNKNRSKCKLHPRTTEKLLEHVGTSDLLELATAIANCYKKYKQEAYENRERERMSSRYM